MFLSVRLLDLEFDLLENRVRWLYSLHAEDFFSSKGVLGFAVLVKVETVSFGTVEVLEEVKAILGRAISRHQFPSFECEAADSLGWALP